MEVVFWKKRKVDNILGDIEWSEMILYKGKGGVICVVVYMIIVYLGGFGSEDMVNMLDEIFMCDVVSLYLYVFLF